MLKEPVTLKEYVTESRISPFNEWLEGLKSREIRAIVRARLNRLRLGSFGDCKSVGDGVSELRIHLSPGYRVYFGKEGNTVVILLYGGTKGSQQRDIEKAKALWRVYRS